MSASKASRESRAPSSSRTRRATRWSSSLSAIPTPCSITEDQPMNSFDIGRELTAIAIGMDKFETSQPVGATPMGGDGLVPIYLGGDSIPPKTYADADGMQADLPRLAEAVAMLPAGPRQVFLQDMVRSLRVAAKMLGGMTPSF